MTNKKGYWDLIGLPDVATIGNLILGFLGIIYLFQGKDIFFIKAILLAGLLDGVDGVIARQRDRYSDFGVEMDSLADLVSFGVAPALFFWVKIPIGYIRLVFPIIFLTAALIRLARYNVSDEFIGFKGVPTTCAGLILIIFLSLELPFFNSLLILVVSILSFLMISPFKFPKFKTKFLLPLGVLLVILISLCGQFFFIGKTILLILLISYLLIGPVKKWDHLTMG